MKGAIFMEDKKYSQTHNLILEDREHMSLSGVSDVSEFNENQIILITQMGILTIDGDELKISELSVETGEMKVEGTINAIVYSDEDLHSGRGSLWSKLFR